MPRAKSEQPPAPLDGVAAAASRRVRFLTTATAEQNRCASRGTVAGDRRAGGPARVDSPRALPHTAASDVRDRRGAARARLFDEGGVPRIIGSGTADQKVAQLAEPARRSTRMCYSDTVPLYTAELLNLGEISVQSSSIETTAKQAAEASRGNVAVRYMEYWCHHPASTSICRWH